MVVKVVPAEWIHTYLLLDNIRQADVQEMEALGLNIDTAVRLSLGLSKLAWTGFIDDKIVCMFGVCPLGSDRSVARPWLFGTKEIDGHEKTFLKHCLPYLNIMKSQYSMLYNHVDTRNERAVKWLKWLGFTMEKAEPYGMMGQPFHRFWMASAPT